MPIARRKFLGLAGISLAGLLAVPCHAAGKTTNFEVLLKHYEDENRIVRSSIGGRPIMAMGQSWPKCKRCKNEMCLVIQFDIRPQFHTRLLAQSHLLVFSCPQHQDPNPSETSRLILNPPGVEEVILPPDPLLLSFELFFQESAPVILGGGPPQNKTISIQVPGNLVPPEETKSCTRCGAKLIQIWRSANETLSLPVKHPCDSGQALQFEDVLLAPPFALNKRQIDKLPRTPADPRCFYAAGFWTTSACSRLYACAAQCSPYSVYAEVWN